MMHGREKSDSAIVAGKPTNKAERSAAEPVEPRAEAKGNAGQQSTHRAQYRERVSKALTCIRQHIVAVDTRGGSRMRESCTYGSERGARGNSRPYRDPIIRPTSYALVYYARVPADDGARIRSRVECRTRAFVR